MDFLWGGLGDDFKFHLVSWLKICTSMSCGGSRFRNLVQFNRALLGNGCGVMLQRGRLCGGQW